MNNLTLVIPAKNESESLPKVLDEISNLQLKVIVVMPKDDEITKSSINNFNCKIINEFKDGFLILISILRLFIFKK